MVGPPSISRLQFEIPLQQERAEVWECINAVVASDVASGKLDAAVNVRVLIAVNQRSE